MAAQNYQTVQIILAEPRPEMGNALQAAMQPRGLREISVCRNVDGLMAALDQTLVDVLLCDIELSGLKFRETMQLIRNNEIGRNPFMHIVAMVGLSGRDMVQRLMGAGVDDLIRKPMPAARLAGRFDIMTRPRKPFIVGDSYVGPNRRRIPRAGDAYHMVSVPNSLRSKSVDNLHPTQVQDLIDRAWVEVADRKSRSRRDVIGVLTRRVMSFYDGQGSPDELRRDLRYLMVKAEELIRRHWETETAHVAEIAACMSGVARRIMQSPTDPGETDLKLMPHLADATRISSQSPNESVDTVREIVGLIRGYLKVG